MAVKDRKKRRCLRCSKDFVSDHSGKRICKSCTILNKGGAILYSTKQCRFLNQYKQQD